MSSRGEAEVWPFALWLACALRLDSQGFKPIAIYRLWFGHSFSHAVCYSYVPEFFVSNGSGYRFRGQLTDLFSDMMQTVT